MNLGSPTDPADDNNGNGIPDGVDYATDNEAALAGVIVDSQLQVTFHRLSNADGITLVVQVSENLSTWTDGSSYALNASTPDTAVSAEISRINDGLEAEWITVGIDTSAPARFVRLKVVMP